MDGRGKRKSTPAGLKRQEKAKREREDDAVLEEAIKNIPKEEEELAQQLSKEKLDKALVPIPREDKLALVPPADRQAVLDYFKGDKNAVALANQLIETMASIRYQAVQRGKDPNTVPFLLPVRDPTKVVNPETARVGIINAPFARHDLLPIPMSEIRKRRNMFTKNMMLTLAMMPICDFPIKTSKLFMYCTGQSQFGCMSFIDEFEYWLILVYGILVPSADIVSLRHKQRILNEFDQHVKEAYDYLDSEISTKYMSFMKATNFVVDSFTLARFEKTLVTFALMLMRCYQYVVLEFFGQENQTKKKAPVASADELFDKAAKNKRRVIMAAGIPKAYYASLASCIDESLSGWSYPPRDEKFVIASLKEEIDQHNADLIKGRGPLMENFRRVRIAESPDGEVVPVHIKLDVLAHTLTWACDEGDASKALEHAVQQDTARIEAQNYADMPELEPLERSLAGLKTEEMSDK